MKTLLCFTIVLSMVVALGQPAMAFGGGSGTVPQSLPSGTNMSAMSAAAVPLPIWLDGPPPHPCCYKDYCDPAPLCLSPMGIV